MISEKLKAALVQSEEQIQAKIAEHPFPTDAFINTCLTLAQPVVFMLAIWRRGHYKPRVSGRGRSVLDTAVQKAGPISCEGSVITRRGSVATLSFTPAQCIIKKKQKTPSSFTQRNLVSYNGTAELGGAERLAGQQTDACHVSCMPEMIAWSMCEVFFQERSLSRVEYIHFCSPRFQLSLPTPHPSVFSASGNLTSKQMQFIVSVLLQGLFFALLPLMGR